MKLLYYLLVTCVLGAGFGLLVAQTQAQAASWKGYKNAKPMDIIDDIVANEETDIIETELDKTYNTQIYGARYKVTGTLESVRQNMDVYLQWIAFLGLAGGVMLIVYNGLLLVISPLSPDQVSKVQKRMIYIASGVLLVTGFYFILKILLSVLVDVLVK